MEAPDPIPKGPWALIQAGEHWWQFSAPLQVLTATRPDQVMPQLQAVEAAVAEGGLYAAGFLSYEAAPACDPALRVRPPGPLPLLWFGLFPAPRHVEPPRNSRPGAYALDEWRPSVSREAYRRAFRQVKTHIAAGRTYQVNLTFRLRAGFSGSPWALFQDLACAQQAQYAAYLDLGPQVVCSASPELFFRLSGHELETRPMKGTAPRGLSLAQDQANQDWLQASEKNRAENVMIVDMVRNDMGRVACTGSVEVPRLFEIERYPTVLQMTSTVRSQTHASLGEIMGALFPCASITGAPKVRTMGIIADLETTPRGLYTGCIGYLAPGRQAQFNVAIRTVTIDRTSAQAEYGVGGGIVWDSQEADEYQEALLKARVLTAARPDFSLLETLLWDPEAGFWLLPLHMQRLSDSAAYFDFPLDREAVECALQREAAALAGRPHRVRLLLSRSGSLQVESCLLENPGNARPLRVALAPEPVDPSDPFLYHKTTQRAVYDRARAAHPECDDTLLWNPAGQLTEATIANLVARFDGQLVTPPVACGLLEGTFRRHLLDQGDLRERVIRVEELPQAEAVYLINSVRGWMPAELVQN